MTPLIILGVVGALFILLLSLLTNNYCKADAIYGGLGDSSGRPKK